MIPDRFNIIVASALYRQLQKTKNELKIAYTSYTYHQKLEVCSPHLSSVLCGFQGYPEYMPQSKTPSTCRMQHTKNDKNQQIHTYCVHSMLSNLKKRPNLSNYHQTELSPLSHGNTVVKLSTFKYNSVHKHKTTSTPTSELAHGWVVLPRMANKIIQRQHGNKCSCQRSP